jgi:putative transposase
LVHPLANRIRARWVWSRGGRYRIYVKLDPVKVEWIIRQKEKGAKNSAIAGSMKISVRRVQELYSSYKKTAKIPELKKPGRRCVETTEVERKMIVEAHEKHRAGAVILERIIDVIYGTHIPHNRIHRAMKSMGIARDEPRKQVRKKWIRYERKYSNSLWHTDWKLIEGVWDG